MDLPQFVFFYCFNFSHSCHCLFLCSNSKKKSKFNVRAADLLQQQQQQHSQLVAHRMFSYDSNGNTNNNQRTAKEYCNLPNINVHRLNTQANRIIAKQTAKKSIKVFTAIDYPVL